MTEIAKAYVQIIPTTTGIKENIEKEMGGAGSEAGEKAGKNFSSGLGKGLATIGAAATAATAAVSAAVIKGVKDTAEYGDNIDKMSQKLGISAKAYQEWDFIAQHSGTTVDGLQASMKTLANAAQNGNENFQKLGISLDDVKNMSQEDLFSSVITGLQEMDEGTERTALASSLLGKAATELAPLLNTSAEETEAMRKQVNELGGVMSDEAVKASAAYGDSLQNLQTSVKGITRGLLTELLPGAVQVMDGLTAVFSGDSSGIAKIKDGVKSIATTFIELIPTLLNVTKEISLSIVKALPEILPEIITATVAFFTTTIPDIISVGIELLTALIEAMPTIIDQIVDALPQIIESIVKTLLANLPKIAKAGFELFMGLVKEIPKVIENFKTVGKNIVDGVWQGIKSMASTLYENVKNFFGGIVDSVKDFLGIHSPSKTFARIGEFTAKGFGVGFSDEMKDVQTDVIKDVNSLVGNVSGINVNSMVSTQPAGRDTFIINVDAKNVQEFNDLVRIAKNARFTARMGAV